jgi:hypothetical protein
MRDQNPPGQSTLLVSDDLDIIVGSPIHEWEDPTVECLPRYDLLNACRRFDPLDELARELDMFLNVEHP